MQTMSKYTMMLSKVCDALTNVERLQSNYELTRDEIIEMARKKIFDFDYRLLHKLHLLKKVLGLIFL